MPQFDVHAMRSTDALAVNCQSDLLDSLETRLIIPLLRSHDVPWSFPRLAPLIRFQDEEYVLATPLAAAVHKSELRDAVGTLAEHRLTIVGAMDLLVSGI